MEKRDDEALKDIFKRSDELEKMYNEMSKESLINMLIFRQMMDEAFDVDEEKHTADLWCYVSDMSGILFLSDEQPHMYLVYKKEDTDGFPTDRDWYSDGQVIRIPDSLRPIFPKLTYGDDPVKIKLSVSF